MLTITLANQKGGVGKSSLALNIASGLQNAGLTVSLSELDVQETLARFAANHPIPLVSPDTDLAGLDTDYLIIDTPPYLTSRLRDILPFTDIVLIPIRPGIADVQALTDTLSLIESSGAKVRVYAVFNSVKHSAKAFVSELQKAVESEGVQVLDTVISDRLTYARSGLYGGIFSAPQDIRDAKAETEINDLIREILTRYQNA